MDRTDYPFETDEWLRHCREKMRVSTDFIGDHPYRHFDGRVSHQSLDTNESKVVPLLKQPEQLIHHSFLPFLRRDKKVRRFTWNRASKDYKVDQKIRPIMYASHRDACIYAFYAFMLKRLYEEHIKGSGLAESIIAYRHIKRDDHHKKGKSNIDFAKDVYDLTKQYPRCAVLCLDISKFFDSMNHGLIKERWAKLLNLEKLPPSHFAVFRNVTNYRYVVLQDALIRLGYGELRKGKFVYKSSKPRSGPLCLPAEYREKIDSKKRPLIHKHKSSIGIPQGSPISDILANLYLEDFDRAVIKQIDAYKFGHYRRYSDDILVICPEDKIKQIYDFIMERIKSERLTIKASKSEVVILDNANKRVDDVTFMTTGLNEHIEYARQAFQYLGFEIDTKDIHIRSGTVAAHYRRAKRRAKATNDSKAAPKPRQKKRRVKSNRSRWQYFISAIKRTASSRISLQYKKVRKRAYSFSADK